MTSGETRLRFIHLEWWIRLLWLECQSAGYNVVQHLNPYWLKSMQIPHAMVYDGALQIGIIGNPPVSWYKLLAILGNHVTNPILNNEARPKDSHMSCPWSVMKAKSIRCDYCFLGKSFIQQNDQMRGRSGSCFPDSGITAWCSLSTNWQNRALIFTVG